MLMEHPNARLSLPSRLLDRLESDDPAAWLEFFHKVYATARQAIDDALAAGERKPVKEARRLVRALDADPVDAHIALDLAWTSFWSHYLVRTTSPDIKDEADCAALLIRVAYNRWQRGRYRDRQVRRQADRGAARGDGPSLIEQQPDLGPGPDEQVALADFLALLEEEVVHFTKHLSEVDREIVRLTFFEHLSPPEIKARLGISTAKSQDVPRLWRLHLLQRYPKTLDLLGLESDLDLA